MDLVGIGRRIRLGREALGLTQSALATRVGVTRSAVAQWETGRSGQVGGNLALVAEALGVGVSHLLLGHLHEAAADPGEAHMTGNERALVEMYRGCSASDQAVLLRIAHQLVKDSKFSK